MADINQMKNTFDKKELKMLQRFMYDEKNLRPRNLKNESFHKQDSNEGQAIEENSINLSSEKTYTGKKRGRKPKNKYVEPVKQNQYKSKSNNNNANINVSKLKQIDYSSIDQEKSTNQQEENRTISNPLSKQTLQNNLENLYEQIKLKGYKNELETYKPNEIHEDVYLEEYEAIDNDKKVFSLNLENHEHEDNARISNKLTENDYSESKTNTKKKTSKTSKPVTDDVSLNSNSVAISRRAYNSGGLNSNTFINCDLRFFNFELLTSRLGSFDIIMADPPWRLKGGQRNDSSFMFSNSKFNLDYNTLSNNEILSIPVDKLSRKGFFFLWVLNSLLDVGYECLNKWGYEVVDQIIWIKTRNNKVYISQGYYFLHSFEICLVGYKCPVNDKVDYKGKISTNIIFADVRSKSQKPEEIYELVEKMMPGAKKLELFARNHNLKEGWFSIGNQLGENYNKWKNLIDCDECNKEIKVGIKRFKSRIIANYDICESCYKNHFNVNIISEAEKPNGVNYCSKKTEEETIINNVSKNTTNQEDETIYKEQVIKNTINGTNKIRINLTDLPDLNNKAVESTSRMNLHNERDFFQLNNNIDEDVLHPYFQCNICNSEPIWGTRFNCITCDNYDLCEACFDKKLLEDNTNKEITSNQHNHQFECIELPPLANGLNIQSDIRCKICYQKPIIGPCFKCTQCKGYNLCQNCFFNSNFIDEKHGSINSEHHLIIMTHNRQDINKFVKW